MKKKKTEQRIIDLGFWGRLPVSHAIGAVASVIIVWAIVVVMGITKVKGWW